MAGGCAHSAASTGTGRPCATASEARSPTGLRRGSGSSRRRLPHVHVTFATRLLPEARRSLASQHLAFRCFPEDVIGITSHDGGRHNGVLVLHTSKRRVVDESRRGWSGASWPLLIRGMIRVLPANLERPRRENAERIAAPRPVAGGTPPPTLAQSVRSLELSPRRATVVANGGSTQPQRRPKPGGARVVA